MTTIAATKTEMAADTRVSDEWSGLAYPAAKIFRVGTSLFGTAGHGTMCLVMIEWLKTVARNRSALYKQWNDYEREQISILEINPGGIFLWDGWGVPERVLADRWAVGSGAKAALVALDHGKSPLEAVEVAANYDIFTHGEFQVEYLKQRRKRG